MLPSTRTLLVCNLFALLCVAVIQITRPGGEATIFAEVERPTVGSGSVGDREGPGVVAVGDASHNEIADAEEQTVGGDSVGDRAGPEVVAVRDASHNEAAETELTGPILLPVNPPYLNDAIEEEPSTPGLKPAADETLQESDEAEATGPGETSEQAAEAAMAPEAMEEAAEKPPQSDQPADEEQLDETGAEPADETEADASDDVAEDTPDEETAERVPEETAERVPDETAERVPDETAETAREEAADETTDEEAADATPPETPPEAQPEPPPELTTAQAAMRDRVRHTVAALYRQPLNLRDNTATELMHVCLAFGCNTQVYRGGSSRQKVNGITSLCWNYPCAGYEALGHSDGRIAARIGYGLQQHHGQLLSVLALSRVQATYPVRVGEDVRTVAELVESEKLSCRSGIDLSLKLIGLSYYAGDQPTWQNDRGEAWSLEQIIKEELARPMPGLGSDAARRLTALGYAVSRRAKRNQPIDGQFLRAQKFLADCRDYALKLQNSDGSWGPQRRTTSRSSYMQTAQLQATGRVLQWLAVWLPEDGLEDPRMLRAVEYLNGELGRYSRTNVPSLTTRDIGMVMQALHALTVYDRRFFQPRTPQQPAKDS